MDTTKAGNHQSYLLWPRPPGYGEEGLGGPVVEHIDTQLGGGEQEQDDQKQLPVAGSDGRLAT